MSQQFRVNAVKDAVAPFKAWRAGATSGGELPLHAQSVKLLCLTPLLLLSSSSSQRPSPPPDPAGLFLLQGRGPMEKGQAILGQTDSVMIADADCPASHSHPGISVWTLMSKTCQKAANYYQRPLSALFRNV